jgi:hypothetical protein
MTAETRPPIPVDLRRRVLVEAGHRCALPTCRHIEVDVHHIVPWETCRKHEYENLIALCPNCHRRADRGEIDRKSLRFYKANLRYTHDRFSQFEVDMFFECYKVPRGEGVLWPPYLMLLIKRLLDSAYVQRVENQHHSVSIGGMRVHPDIIMITDKGREFIDSLGIQQPDYY